MNLVNQMKSRIDERSWKMWLRMKKLLLRSGLSVEGWLPESRLGVEEVVEEDEWLPKSGLRVERKN